MSVFLVCLNAVLPVFILMAVGFFARLCGLMEEKDVIKMNRVTFKVFLPVMLFYNIYVSDLSSAVRPKLIVFAAVGVLVVFFLGIAFTLMVFKNKHRQGVIIQGIYRSNFVIIGLPIAASLLENADLSAVAVLMAVIVPMFNMLAVICLETFNGKKVKPMKVFVDVLKNPLIIGSALGLACVLLGIRFPAPVDKVLMQMSQVAGPLMLFLLGAFFRFDSMKKYVKELIAVCMGKLVIVPGLMLSLAYMMGFRGIEFVAVLGVFASSASVSSFTMAQQMGGDAELAGNIVVATSVLCSFTLYGWSVLFKALGAI